MFSPSQLVQSLVQRANVSAPKPVELTPGQVFTGTVLRTYPDSMALVQIGGMQVQARLEANLEAGHKAWLQVQPSAGVVTLKVLGTTRDGGAADASLEGLIRSLGLNDTKENRAIVQELVQARLPVTRETVQAFAAIAQRLGMSKETVDAFLLAAKRNLPLTPDVVAGLRTFLSKQPISQAIQAFLQQAEQFLQTHGERAGGQASRNGSAAASFATSPSAPAAAPLLTLVGQLKQAVAGLAVLLPDHQGTDDRMSHGENGQPSAGTANAAGTNGKAQAPLPSSAAAGALRLETSPHAMTAATGSSGSNGMDAPRQGMTAASDGTLTGATPLGSGTAKMGEALAPNGRQQGVPLAGSSGLPVGGTAADSASTRNGGQTPQAATSGPHGTGTPNTAAATTVNGATSVANPASTNQAAGSSHLSVPSPAAGGTTGANAAAHAQAASAHGHPIQELFQRLGLGHERDLMSRALAHGMDAAAQRQLDSVKALLLQLSQETANAVPAALRDTADALLQHITGQQLMLVQPSSQTLSQVVMQIPIRTQQGDETAYVQIEAKKRGGGELDPENCRLFFHLELNELGTTMVDVAIVNRIVSVQLFNNTPWVEALAQEMKEGFARQLHEAGYQLSGLRVQGIPDSQPQAAAAATGSRTGFLADYKGVDIRV
ncbi:hypothetical protein FOI68_11545 [Brevibacillus sp. LEMMJ03]|uniref:hypothetical protein n=1 Tax=Brevibacillus sp. LEMMJ03 TaxID=2595056 RepID=UPI00117F4024|nr:hypothetical protein [Brevibacillus sp. LEMMJ03]TRY25449.1 hypothetical protein FOI68_11545 [Brevibacillus sp. LEMMJ03]